MISFGTTPIISLLRLILIRLISYQVLPDLGLGLGLKNWDGLVLGLGTCYIQDNLVCSLNTFSLNSNNEKEKKASHMKG